MVGSKIFVLCLLPLLLDGARSDSDVFRGPQPGKPWVAPTFKTENINEQKQAQLDRYISQLYQTPAPEMQNAESPEATIQQPEKSPQRYSCPQRDGYFKYTSRCDEYVKCKNYIPITYTCPMGLHFNPYLQWTDFPCDHPSRVKCNEPTTQKPQVKTTSTTTTTTTTPPPPPSTTKVIPQPPPVNQPNEFMCPQPHGYYKNAGQCGEYIECKNYVPLTFICPVGLHFNPLVPWTEYPCDHPSKVQCIEKEKTTTTSTTTTTTTTTTTPAPAPLPKLVPEPRPVNNFVCPQPHGYFRHSDQCGEYTECKNYKPLTYTCPGGLHFNPQVSWTEYPCVHPSTVQCNREPIIPSTAKYITTTEPTTTTTTTTTTPPPPPPTTTPAIIAPRPKIPEPNYLCPQPYGYFKHSNQCGEYVECKNYVPLMFTCPVGLHFNPSVQWTEYPCEHPAKVQCEEQPFIPKSPITPRPTTARPTTTTTTTTLPPPTTPKIVTTPRPGKQLPDYQCPKPHGYFEHDGQCGEYVECKNHVPLSYSCPTGLHFNPRVQWTEYPCEHPIKAQCSSRRK